MSDTSAPKPDLGANQEGHNPSDYLSVPILARQAAMIVAEKNLPISGSRVRKLVRRFVRDGRTDVDFRTWFIANADPTGRTWFIGYRDPVGEKAVRNVERERVGGPDAS